MTALTEAEVKLQTRRIEQINVANALNRYKFDDVDGAIAAGFDGIADRLRADFEKVFGGER